MASRLAALVGIVIGKASLLTFVAIIWGTGNLLARARSSLPKSARPVVSRLAALVGIDSSLTGVGVGDLRALALTFQAGYVVCHWPLS